MRRVVLVLLLVPAVAGLGVPPAAAHATFHIAGFQYLWQDGFQAGVSGWLSVPPAPVRVASLVPANDGLDAVVNQDNLTHTFTQCAARCDTGTPTWGRAFDIELAPGERADLGGLPVTGTVVFGCRIHPFMRGEITIQG